MFNTFLLTLQIFRNQGDLSSYLPRTDQQNPSIPQVPAVAGSQKPVRAQSVSPTLGQQMSQFSTRPAFSPAHVDVGQPHSSPGQSPALSPTHSSPAHSPVPRQQFRSQSLSPAPRAGNLSGAQGQDYHSLPVGYGQGYPSQGQTAQFYSLPQERPGYQSVPPGQMTGPHDQAYLGKTQQYSGPQNTINPSRPGAMPSQPPTNYIQSDPRQVQQSVDTGYSNSMVHGRQHTPQSSQHMMAGQQSNFAASSSSSEQPYVSSQLPASQFQHSQANVGRSQTPMQMDNYGQSLSTEQVTGGGNQQTGQYYQNQMQPPSQRIPSQQPQQFRHPQFQGVENPNQQLYQPQLVSAVPSAQQYNQQQNMYASQQPSNKEQMMNQTVPNKNMYVNNQIDPTIEGKSHSDNFQLGMPYASTYQSRPAQSFSHSDNKFQTVDSGDQNLAYGHQAHSHQEYAPQQSDGPALQHTKWDAKSQQSQQQANNSQQDPRYQTGKIVNFLETRFE